MDNKPPGIKIAAISVIVYAIFVLVISAGSIVLFNFLPEDSKMSFLAGSKPFGAENVGQFGVKVRPVLLFLSFISIIVLASGAGLFKLKNWARRTLLVFSAIVFVPSLPGLFLHMSITEFLHAVGFAALFIYLMRPSIKRLFLENSGMSDSGRTTSPQQEI